MNGSTALHLLPDGHVKMDGGTVFGQVPKTQWQEWLAPDRQNRVRLALNCLLVRVGDRNYLIDTSSGQKSTSPVRDHYGMGSSRLLQALKAHQLLPQDIHGVVLSSLHFEHTGGCTKWDRRGELVPTFPKATYYVQAKALEEALAPSERQANIYSREDFLPLYEKGHIQLLDGDTQLAPGLHALITGGPCAGHQIILITHGGEWVAYLGDLVPTPYHLQLACISSADRNPEDTLEQKRRMLDRATKEGWLLVFSHGVNERAGYLEHHDGKPMLRKVEL